MLLVLLLNGKICIMDLSEFNLHVHDIIFFTVLPMDSKIKKLYQLIDSIKESINKHTISKLDSNIKIAGWYYNYEYISELDRWHIDGLLDDK